MELVGSPGVGRRQRGCPAQQPKDTLTSCELKLHINSENKGVLVSTLLETVEWETFSPSQGQGPKTGAFSQSTESSEIDSSRDQLALWVLI